MLSCCESLRRFTCSTCVYACDVIGSVVTRQQTQHPGTSAVTSGGFSLRPLPAAADRLSTTVDYYFFLKVFVYTIQHIWETFFL